ncbi:MAG: hypothetical protein ABEJ44_06495 [Halanaeroarchaeum sp.]
MFSSDSSAQVEPLPALVAVSALVAAIGVYAVAFHGVPTGGDRGVADRALAVEVEAASTAGLLDPTAVVETPPAGYEMAAVVRVEGTTWWSGPRPPDRASTATRPVLVKTAAGEEVGRIRVWVWR